MHSRSAFVNLVLSLPAEVNAHRGSRSGRIIPENPGALFKETRFARFNNTCPGQTCADRRVTLDCSRHSTRLNYESQITKRR